ncbi:hypothetical protein [Erythrobacter cryptus]|uniref:hypothetical protein n=1 Tax=Erythrobacter cryptus TaxID=196588 RepID=UPI000426038A|nr:hypothetical protein [Erythrobacter cryptus]GIX21058.1 MAG: hypothetical protein KatS3mg120_2734 [Erythrobacter sp.]
MLPCRALALLAACPLALAACAGAPPPRPAAPAPGVAGARSSIVVVPQVMRGAGLDGVIGETGAALTRRLGTPRLTLTEGDARKLQFAGPSCVLDIYLYPLRAGAEPTATHLAARQRQGGAPRDPADCLRELERR